MILKHGRRYLTTPLRLCRGGREQGNYLEISLDSPSIDSLLCSSAHNRTYSTNSRTSQKIAHHVFELYCGHHFNGYRDTIGNASPWPEDLPKVRVGAISNAKSESYLRKNRIYSRTYETALDGLQAVADGRVEALVYDAPILQDLVAQKFKGELEALPQTFVRQD